MVVQMTIIKFPGADLCTPKELLEKALKDDLTNVIILSQRENGDIYHAECDSMTLGEVNWIIDSYKAWLMNTAGEKHDAPMYR